MSGLDILVNNAAATVKPSLLADLSEDDFDLVMAVNMRAAFLTMRHAAQVMRDGGRIVNISTLNTRSPSPGVFAYAASKAAIEQFTAVAAIELGGRGITVNSVLPGATESSPVDASELWAVATWCERRIILADARRASDRLAKSVAPVWLSRPRTVIVNHRLACTPSTMPIFLPVAPRIGPCSGDDTVSCASQYRWRTFLTNV